ncbi:MAG TPA: hypothetical protein VMW34_14345, partial [Anaerolineales bacterium]|nr:hypothetical protein [Anaerolineales bacterium]
MVSILSLLIIVRRGAIQEVQTYMFRGGMAGLESIVTDLEDYYQSNQSWEGAEQVLKFPGQYQGNRRGTQGNPPGMGGMMSQNLQLTDVQGNLIVDSRNPNA